MVFVADMVYCFWLVVLWDLSRRRRGGSVAGQPQSTGGSFLRGSDEPGTALDRVKCRCYCEGAGLCLGTRRGRLRAERVVLQSSRERYRTASEAFGLVRHPRLAAIPCSGFALALRLWPAKAVQ